MVGFEGRASVVGLSIIATEQGQIITPACAIHQHQRLRQQLLHPFPRDARLGSPSQKRVPAGFGNGLETVEQGAQGREGVLGQDLRRPSEEQLAIGGASCGLEEGEEEGVGST